MIITMSEKHPIILQSQKIIVQYSGLNTLTHFLKQPVVIYGIEGFRGTLENERVLKLAAELILNSCGLGSITSQPEKCRITSVNV